MRKMNKKGFTIVELVIVIAVIAILSAVLIPTFSGVVANAKNTAAVSDAKAAYQQYLYATAETSTGEEKLNFVYKYATDMNVIIKDGEVVEVKVNANDTTTVKFVKDADLANAVKTTFGTNAKVDDDDVYTTVDATNKTKVEGNFNDKVNVANGVLVKDTELKTLTEEVKDEDGTVTAPATYEVVTPAVIIENLYKID